MSRAARPLLCVATTLAAASSACACPVCDTATGRQVRGRIVDADFADNLLVTALPFAVLLAVAAVLHFGVPWRRRGTTPSGPPSPSNTAPEAR